MKIFFRWLINAAALMAVAGLVPGFAVDSFYAALVAAFVLGLANALIRPILLVLTLPITVLTLGLFTFVVNALMVWFVSSVVKGFSVEGFVPAFVGALLLWAVSMGTNRLIRHAEAS